MTVAMSLTLVQMFATAVRFPARLDMIFRTPTPFCPSAANAEQSAMIRSFKPRVEILEDRLALSAVAVAPAPSSAIDGTSNTVLVGEQAHGKPASPLPVL